MGYEMKIEWHGVVRYQIMCGTPTEVHKELKRKCIEDVIKKLDEGVELIIKIKKI